MRNSKKIDLSVIILSFNTASFLVKCLDSVKKAREVVGEDRVEVIVVDNASRDKSVSLVRKRYPWVVLVVNKDNFGFAGGNNAGLRRSSGRYVLFLNSDTVIFPKAFVELLKYLDHHPRAGALTAKTLLADGVLDPDCHRGFPTPLASLTYFLGLEKLFPHSRIFGQYHQAFLNMDRHHEIDAGAGAFMAVRREVIQQVGEWDETYFFYGEDLDYYYRIKRAGWTVDYYARPLLTHYKGLSSGLRRESRRYTRAERSTRLKVAQESVRAMDIFYRKFYQDRYSPFITGLVLAGIRLKGWWRYAYQWLRR